MSGQAVPGAGAAPAPLHISLPQAIEAALRSDSALAAARAADRSAALARQDARAALLPGVIAHNQVLYTQPNGVGNAAGGSGSQPAPVFIANNAVREYATQAVIGESFSAARVAAVSAADAGAALARAELEVERRGLTAATANLFYAAASAEARVGIALRARDEASDFLTLTRNRETAREAAHADVVKAELTAQERERELADAGIASSGARLELGVLLFDDPRTPFSLDGVDVVSVPPADADLESAARLRNPELAAALAALQQSSAEIAEARAAYLPDLNLNFTYGIDASQFATKGRFDAGNDPPRQPKNLGYSAGATVDIPVWDWLSTHRHVEEAESRRDAQKVALTAAQRRLIAGLQQAETEAKGAFAEMESLDRSVTSAGESLRLVKLRYTAGEGTVLEVVDAQASLVGAQTAREDGLIRYRRALSALEILTGELR